MHFKHEQSQVDTLDSHVTIGTIQQTEGTANVLWVDRHNSRHAASPTVILRLMETRWKTLALSPWNLIRWIKPKFMNNLDIKFWRIFIELAPYTCNWLYAYCLPQFAGGPLDLEALGLSLYSLLVNPAMKMRCRQGETTRRNCFNVPHKTFAVFSYFANIRNS